jgi:hypothetical protein
MQQKEQRILWTSIKLGEKNQWAEIKSQEFAGRHVDARQIELMARPLRIGNNAWDSMLLNNGEKIVKLNKAVEKVKADQTTLEQELEFIAQQNELEDSILLLEQELAK